MISEFLQKLQIRSPIHDEKKVRLQGMQARIFAPRFGMPSRLTSLKTDFVVRPSAAAISSIGGFGSEKYRRPSRSISASNHGSPPFPADITRSSRSP
jgi:hypothetical protein